VSSVPVMLTDMTNLGRQGIVECLGARKILGPRVA
jgi:hypothetical protein